MLPNMVVTGWPAPNRSFHEECAEIFNNLPNLYPTENHIFFIPRHRWQIIGGFEGHHDRALWARYISDDPPMPYVSMRLATPGLQDMLRGLVLAGEGMATMFHGVEFAFMDKADFPELQWQYGPIAPVCLD